MKNCAFPTLIAGVTFMLGLCAFAQTGGPSNVIKIIREDIKPGRDAAHEVVEQGYVRVLAKVKYPHYFALTTVTGPNEVWFVEGYPSFDAVGTMRDTIDSSPFKAELDKLDSEDGELKTGGRTLLAGYEKDLSYLGDQYGNVRGKNHYVSVTIVRTRIGRYNDFSKMRKIINDAHAKAEHKDPILVYGVRSGAPTGTFLIIRGMLSLKSMDPVQGEMTMLQAIGEDNMKEYSRLAGDTIAASDPMLFAFSPKMSYVSDETAAKDPAFWRPKTK